MISHVYVCSSYFDKMRKDVLTDCQVKIAYHFRKYWKRKQIRLAKEKAALEKKKALAAKKGKKKKAKKKGKKK